MTSVLNITGDDRLIFESRGLIFQDMEVHGDAIHDFNRAIELDGHNPDAYIYRGASLLKIKKPAEAIKDFEKAI
jgi:tetratricopeptide (TPR) repeat protein